LLLPAMLKAFSKLHTETDLVRETSQGGGSGGGSGSGGLKGGRWLKARRV
jgi:hypothetical protein